MHNKDCSFDRGGLGFRSILLLVALSLCLTGPAWTQTVFMLGGSGKVAEITGPPGACDYPNGPQVSGYIYISTGGTICPMPSPIPVSSLFGGMASDPQADSTWLTDGKTVVEFDSKGGATRIFTPTVIGGITGLAWDWHNQILYLTDGKDIVGVRPPAPPGCLPESIIVPPWQALTAGFITGLSWDPVTDTLWACDDAGEVSQIKISGTVQLSFPIGPGGLCSGSPGVNPVLLGIAVETTSSPTTLVVTDGKTVLRTLVGGLPAPPTLASPSSCYAIPIGDTMHGLAFQPHAITYGDGSDPTGASEPQISATGAWIPGGSIVLRLTGADSAPGTLAGLFLSPSYSCPAIPFLHGNLLYLNPFPPSIMLGPIVAMGTTGGSLTLPAGLPSGPALPGVAFQMQWLISKGSGGFQASDGLSVIMGQP